jgi:hypothetical protein
MRFGIPYWLNNLNNRSINITFEGTLDACLDAVIYPKLRSRACAEE